jgi:hypothetical protein
MKGKILYWLLCIGGLLSSCGDSEPSVQESSQSVVLNPPSRMRIEQICRAYIDGDYVSYIGLMHNYKSKDQTYKQRLLNMMKQRAADRSLSQAVLEGYRTNRVKLHEPMKTAEVYVELSYGNGQQEEVVLPLIYDEGEWWVK